MKRLMSFVTLSLGLLILTACARDDTTQGQPTPTVTENPTPTATVVPPRTTLNSVISTPAALTATSEPTRVPTPTATPMPTPSPTSTRTPISTAIPVPTETAIPVPAATLIPTPTPTPQPTATPEPTPTPTPAPVYAFVTGSDSIKLTSSDSGPHKFFGTSVAIDSNTVIASVHADFEKGTNAGAAVVFARTNGTWTQQAKLIGSNTGPGHLLGQSVDISGNTAVIGAVGDTSAGTNSGSAYVFVRSHGVWTQQAKLSANDAGPEDKFGQSAAISDDTIIIGAPSDTPNGTDSGSAYIFTRDGDTWTQQSKLIGDPLSVNSMFGWSVDIDGDTTAVGALNDESSGLNSGAAYVFTRDRGVWTEQANLTGSDTTSEHNFGRSVALSGDTLAIGAPGHHAKGVDTGAAYVFLRSAETWTEQAKLAASNAYTTSNFGWSVTLSGDTVVAGAFGQSDKGNQAGAAYAYKRSGTTWTEEAKLTATGAAIEHKMGTSVALDGNDLVSGAPGDFQKGTNTGAAHVFTAQVQ